MKKLLALLAVALIATTCGENDNDDTGRPMPGNWFLPLDIAVEGTTAEVRCLVLAGDDVLQAADAGFFYNIVGSDEEGEDDENRSEPVTVTDVEKADGVLSCRLENLAGKTTYAIRAYLELGPRRMESDEALFETGEAAPEPEPKPEPGPEPEPDPEPTPQPNVYSGWPELPKMEERPGDYYYATHFCPAFTTAAGSFEEHLRSYTVCYSRGMMSGMWSAYPIHESYKGSSDRTNAWAFDPIVPKSVQPYLVSGSYKPQTGGYSRGHLLASNDRTATAEMNKQTFYVTNMAPQKQTSFNDGIWSTLEKNTWNNVCPDTLFVVSGVWFADTDETVMDNASPQNTVCVPTNFYKVMIRSKSGNTGKPLHELKADEMQCVAFWFENKSYPGASLSTFRTTVADIEQKTGMTFFVNVPEAPKNSSAGNWRF